VLVDRVLDEARRYCRPGQMDEWVHSMSGHDWDPLTAANHRRVSALRQRTLLAPVIALIEGGWSGTVGAAPTASGGINLAFAIIPSRKAVYLPTADATLDLGRMLRVRFAQDDPGLTEALARFLRGFVSRKGLVTGLSLPEGSRYLALYFGLMRWYSVARAA